MHGISLTCYVICEVYPTVFNLVFKFFIHKEFKAIISKKLVFLANHSDSTVKVLRSIASLLQSRVNKKC